MLYLAVEIVLLVFVTIALLRMMGAVFNPDKQMSYANVQKLATAMNEACLTGKSSVDNFQLPQPSPTKMWGISDWIPKIALGLGGDPHYVLYYEAFPPGEGIGWEVYEGMNYRVVAPLPDPDKLDGIGGCPKNEGDGKKPEITKCEVNEFISNVKKDSVAEIQQLEQSLPEGKRTEVTVPDVVVPNIILDNQKKAGTPLTKTDSFPGTVGEWNFGGDSGEDYYTFDNYFTLPIVQKSFVKYRACGENSLCMKTREGVYKFPLDYCKDSSGDKTIKTIRIDYDARYITYDEFKVGVGETVALGVEAAFIGTIAEALAGSPQLAVAAIVATGASVRGVLLDFYNAGANIRSSDFYIASPCSSLEGGTTLEIEKTECSCSKYIEYPLYQLNENTQVLEKKSEHFQCLDSIENEGAPEITDKIPCLKITINYRKKGFCWTPDTDLDKNLKDKSWLAKLGSGLSLIDYESRIAALLGGRPIKDSTDYYNGDIIFKPTANIELGMIKALQAKWNWAWPGGG